MALAYDGAIQRLIDAFAHLPGIGPKGAQRIASTCSTHPTRNHRG
jgi:recombination protein RecR